MKKIIRIKLKKRVCGMVVFMAVFLMGAVLSEWNSMNASAAADRTELNRKKVTIKVGSKKTLKVRRPSKKIIWKSTNKKIAVVRKTSGKNRNKAVIAAKKAGHCRITAKMGKKKFICRVTVNPKRASSGTQDVPDTPTSPVTQGAAGVYVTSATASPSAIEVNVKIFNGLSHQIAIGYGFYLEKWNGHDWVRIVPQKDMPFPAVAILLKKQEEFSMTCRLTDPVEPLTSGRYRITLTALSGYSNTAEFTVDVR